MNKNNHAIVVGVNNCQDKDLPPLLYAEKDCIDMRDILTNANSGIFSDDNVKMLIGDDATTNAVKRVLRTEVVTNRDENDFVLVYFAGHGFVHELEDRKRTYLGTVDADVQNIYKYPHEGLEMDFLHNEIFVATKAKVVLVILDCCHSGAIVPDSLRDTGTRNGDKGKRLRQVNKNELNLVDGRYISGSGRVALVACAADATSREAHEFKNGVFTYYLVEGLRGRAAEPTSGDVTLDSLSSYIRYKLPREQEPVRYGQDIGRLILARDRHFGIQRFKKTSTAPSIEPLSLSHPLEPFGPFLDEVMDRIRVEESSKKDLEIRVLDAIRKSINTDATYIMGSSGDEIIIRAFSESDSERRDFKSDLTRVISLLAPQVIDERFTRRTSHGLYYVDDNIDRRSMRVVVVPATFEPATDLIVISGMKDEPLITDAFGVIIAALFTAARGLRPEQEHLFEHAVLDDLKKSYGFVPSSMYNRRLSLFRQRLNLMTVFFQPIVFLQPENPTLDSWEALARDPSSGRAPHDLFDAAELWGRKFMRELDCYFLWKAAALSRSHHAFSGSGYDKEISINVYPQSLMDDAYFDRLGKIIEQGLLVPQKLNLEISEKVPISTIDVYGNADEELHEFKERLEEYVQQHQVNFAIDDFGVRHSSVSRLARLNPEYVKIDRDVLLSNFADLIVNFVLDLTKKGRLRAVKCVIEGFDVDSKVSLAKLYQIGIRYVQGFRIEIPTPQPEYLDNVKVDYIKKLLADQTQIENDVFR